MVYYLAIRIGFDFNKNFIENKVYRFEFSVLSRKYLVVDWALVFEELK